MTLRTDVTNTKNHEDLPGPAETGAYVHGFFLEGAGWELGRGGE
jgi:dynein heavy chain